MPAAPPEPIGWESTDRIGRWLAEAGNKDHTIKMYPKADHGLMVETGERGERRGHRVAGYYDLQIEWVLRRAGAVR